MADLLAALRASASGLHAQSRRLRVIAENVANAETTAAAPERDPYRRKTIAFKEAVDAATGARTVEVDRVAPDAATPFRLAHEPGHPAADGRGYVRRPNVNTLLEMADMREASRSYEANLKALETGRDMLARALAILG